MRNIFKTLIFLLLFVQRSSSAFAWGAQGHRLIVEMAIALLNPAAKQRVLEILNGYPPDDAAVWMDSVRINHVPGWAYMTPWHFLDMDPGQTYVQVASNNDVVSRLNEVIKELQHPEAIPSDSLSIKLRILFHLMGDITQPLHVGYGYDTGGNTVKVKSPIPHGSKELHAVWDDDIIIRGKIDLQSSLAYYHGLDQDTLNSILAGSTQDWMMQARSNLTAVYNFQQVKGGVSQLTLKYLDRNVSVVQQQLVFAAVRLSNLLNTVFGGQS